MAEPILALADVSKRFPGVLALDGVSLAVGTGSCHGLVGENGAGKSTLGKIIAGLYTPDSGSIRLDGAAVTLSGPGQAIDAGIAMVHQELLFCENLSVAENLCLGDIPHRGPWVHDGEMVARAARWLEAIGAGNLDPRSRLGELPISKQQLVQIAAGIGKGARILIFDEPTSSLSQGETQRLMRIIQDLQARGITCIYVSHRLEEVFALCDTVTVLRDGKVVSTAPIGSFDRSSLVRAMVGRELAGSLQTHEDAPLGDPILRVEQLGSPGKFSGVSFTLKRGEILGFAGLVGAGRTEVAEALFGLDREASGKVEVDGRPLTSRTPREAIDAGIALVPEDRKRHGIIPGMAAGENITLPTLDEMALAGFVRPSREKTQVGKYFRSLRIKASSPRAPAVGLSGGNQQKLVLAKWLAAHAPVLIVDEPTRGVDVGAKAEIHELLREQARRGSAILMISSELPELLALCHRILVMREGRIVAEVLAGDASEEALMRHMTGLP